jgi:signal transduction histidine kinase
VVSAVSVSGWIAAGLVTAMVLGVRRSLGNHMEAVARACHELRGPLAAARLGLAVDSGVPAPSAVRLRAIDTELSRAALALQDLAEVRGGELRLGARVPVNVRALVAGSVEAWQGSADAAGVSLRMSWPDDGGTVWGDRLRLAQATGNLIANALEHGGGVVWVRGVVRGTVVRVTVSDDGPGLPASVAELCRRARGGRGARGRGLAISRDVAVAHGGRLAAAPAQRGACLVLELPLAGGGTPESPSSD